jgi:hypothetical protein
VCYDLAHENLKASFNMPRSFKTRTRPRALPFSPCALSFSVKRQSGKQPLGEKHLDFTSSLRPRLVSLDLAPWHTNMPLPYWHSWPAKPQRCRRKVMDPDVASCTMTCRQREWLIESGPTTIICIMQQQLQARAIPQPVLAVQLRPS